MNLGSIAPKIGNLAILDTTPDSFTIQAEVNFTNPTNYSATVPYIDINLLTNGTIIGHVTARDILVVPGNNTNTLVQAVWSPLALSGDHGKAIGAEFLSQYISGFNTTLTLKTHKDTLPSQPALGEALSAFNITIPTPHLGSRKPVDPDHPGDGEDDKPHFIQSTTMHLISSTAQFTLLSPLKKSTIYITHINATAYYKDDDAGHINYDGSFAVPPGVSVSPRLPVEWSLGSVGFEAVRKALGGELKLSARAGVGVRVGRWEERVWFRGGAIGANVRL